MKLLIISSRETASTLSSVLSLSKKYSLLAPNIISIYGEPIKPLSAILKTESLGI